MNNVHELAQSFIPALLATGHFTLPADGDETPRLIIGEANGESYVPVIDEAYLLASILIKKAQQ